MTGRGGPRRETGGPRDRQTGEVDDNPTPPPARRVRVVLAGDRTHRGDPARREIEEQTPVGEVLVRGLVRAQLTLAVRLSLVAGSLLGLPLLFALAPGLRRTAVAGLSLPWLLLGVLAYPAMIAVAWAYVRLAERNERDFAALVDQSLVDRP